VADGAFTGGGAAAAAADAAGVLNVSFESGEAHADANVMTIGASILNTFEVFMGNLRCDLEQPRCQRARTRNPAFFWPS
jgi:hypothetical protein